MNLLQQRHKIVLLRSRAISSFIFLPCSIAYRKKRSSNIFNPKLLLQGLAPCASLDLRRNNDDLADLAVPRRAVWCGPRSVCGTPGRQQPPFSSPQSPISYSEEMLGATLRVFQNPDSSMENSFKQYFPKYKPRCNKDHCSLCQRFGFLLCRT